MGFCTKCGRQLADGEVCNCQAGQETGTNQAGQTANVNQAAPTTASSIIPDNVKAQATEISHGLLTYLKDFFTNPITAAEGIVSENSFVTTCALAAVGAVVELLYSIFRLLKFQSRYNITYEGSVWAKAIFSDIVWWIAIPAALAGIIVLCGKLIEKQDVNFKKAISVFAVLAVPVTMFNLFKMLQLLLAHEFFTAIFGILKGGIGGMMLYLAGIGVTKVIKKSDKFLYVIGIICASLWFVDWLVNSVIFA